MTQTTTEAPATVSARGLTKRFGPVTAVDGVDLTIRPGEVVALLGPNGAGKSTTIDMLLGLARPDAGEVTVHGQVGAMLQSGGLLPDLTVVELVTLMASLHTRRRPVREALRRAGLTDAAKQRVGTLSGGQQQRVRFAMALVADPDLIVLDEPTTGLDVEARRAFWASMRQETAQGRTVLFATHYLEEADDYADRIVLMRAGRVVADGPPAQIKALAAGRTIRASLPGADLAALAALPGVTSVEARSDLVILTCAGSADSAGGAGSDAALRGLLATTAARDIEVTAQNLEDAFIALTVDAPVEGAHR